MSDTHTDGHSVALAVVALFAGILIGIVAAGIYSVDDEVVTTGDEIVGVSQAQSEYDSALKTNLQSHVLRSIDSLQSTYQEREGAEFARAATAENAEDIAATFGVVFGDEVESELSQYLGEYVDALHALAEASREGDAGAITPAEEALDESARQVAAYLGEITEEDNESDLIDNLLKHNQNLRDVFNAYVAGNFEESYRLQDEASAHMRMVADQITEAVVDAHPDRF